MSKKYKMEIDPRILELLGPNLYTNIYYVLAELIANSYDADAENVYIIQKDNEIIVEDDGSGMSYDKGDVKNYLRVAVETRTDEKNSYTNKLRRRKMGRKGVGKLSALAASKQALVMTAQNGEKSGFVLSRQVGKDHLLESIPDENIRFERVEGDGTSIVMQDPYFSLNKTMTSVKRNLLKIFPLVSSKFRIHLVIGDKEEVIDDFNTAMIKDLGGVIFLGEHSCRLLEYFTNEYPDKEKKLMIRRGEKKEILKLKNKDGEEKEYELIIKGWIGFYKTTRGIKRGVDDFPDNFISIISNGKLGEYNILPKVGKNKLNEVYIVGQLYIDLFEETELPDMTLSNRQGYKTDDLRYKKAVSYVRDELLIDAINLRKLYASYKTEAAKKEKILRHKEKESLLKKKAEEYQNQLTHKVAEGLGASMQEEEKGDIKKLVESKTKELYSLLDFKKEVDEEKKKILLSHVTKDKVLCDVIYKMLLFNNVPAEDIIYSNSEKDVSRFPEDVVLLDYLRDFFVESISNEGLYVIFVTSKDMEESWYAVLEAGAGWITKVDHKVFTIEGYTPKPPLNVGAVWHTTKREAEKLTMSTIEYDQFAVKIRHVGEKLGYPVRSHNDNKNELKRYIEVV